MSFPSAMFYTTAQLRMFHHQFAHQSAGKLYALLNKARLEAVDANTLEALEKIVAEVNLVREFAMQLCASELPWVTNIFDSIQGYTST